MSKAKFTQKIPHIICFGKNTFKGIEQHFIMSSLKIIISHIFNPLSLSKGNT